MKRIKTNNFLKLLFLATTLCFTLGSCQKKVTPEERKKNLEAMISEEDCRQITDNALQNVLKELRDINYEKVLKSVQEDAFKFDKNNNLYIQIVVSGNVRGKLNDVDSVYYFYLYGRIPENLADKKEFDDDGYNFSLKNVDGVFLYSNKENVDSLNNAVAESKKEGEEMRKKDFVIGNAKVVYEGKDGNTKVYSSNRELIPDEIAEAVRNKIESEGVNAIQFFNGSEKYADFVYQTQCIIYVKYPDKIYKIIGGNPVRL